MEEFFADVDLLLSPVVTGPPLPARPWHERSFVANIAANARWAPWTAAWNLAAAGQGLSDAWLDQTLSGLSADERTRAERLANERIEQR